MVACLKIGFSPCKAKEKSEIALVRTKGFPTGEPSETKGGGGVRIISLEGFCSSTLISSKIKRMLNHMFEWSLGEQKNKLNLLCPTGHSVFLSQTWRILDGPAKSKFRYVRS